MNKSRALRRFGQLQREVSLGIGHGVSQHMIVGLGGNRDQRSRQTSRGAFHRTRDLTHLPRAPEQRSREQEKYRKKHPHGVASYFL